MKVTDDPYKSAAVVALLGKTMPGVVVSVTQPFAYNQSPEPWHGVPDFCPYSDDDNDRITKAVVCVCRAKEQSILVRVLEDYGSFYYVAVVRCDLRVNIVQFRMDFSAAGKYSLRERPVLVQNWTKRVFPRIEFDSGKLSVSDLAVLFWDPLRVESLAQCNSLSVKVPSPALFLPDVFYYGGRNCFQAAVVFADANMFWFNDDGFRHMLSVSLMDAVARPAERFACVLPFDGDQIEQRINHRKYVGIVRDGGSADINVVFFDGNMKQCRMVFFAAFPIVAVTEIQELPGFNLVSRRLVGADKDNLLQWPVLMHWTRPANRIEPVASSIALFAHPFVFEYDQNATPFGPRAFVRFDEFACRRIQEGLALVCCSGGPTEMLVQIHANRPLGALSFLVIHRDVRDVFTTFVQLFRDGSIAQGFATMLSLDFRATLPHITFSTCTDMRVDWQLTLILNVLRAVWDRRIDQIHVVTHPRIVTNGSGFDYFKPGGLVGSLPSLAANRIERAIRAVCADTSVGPLLVPVMGSDPLAFVTVIPVGSKVSVGYISGLDTMHLIGPLRSVLLDLPNLTYMPFVFDQAMAVTPAIARDLFEQPLFSHWQQVAETNPHNWCPRAVAIGLGVHPRAGANSLMRVLDAELIALVAMLCL